jgi:hypothetical protein
MLETTTAKGGAKREENRKRDSHQVRKDNHVLKLTRQPYQIQRVLVDRHLVRQGRGVVAAQPAAAVRVDADAKVAHARLEVRGADDVADGCVDVVVDLCGVGHGRVVLVVEAEEEDVGD